MACAFWNTALSESALTGGVDNAFDPLDAQRRAVLSSATRAAAFVALTAACLPIAARARDVAQDKTREILINGFTELTLDVPADVVVRAGHAPRIRIQAEPAVLQKISVRSAGSALIIATNGSFSTQRPLRIEVDVVTLQRAQVRSAGDVQFIGLKGPAFHLQLQGAGNTTLTELNLNAFTLHLDGSGDVQASGYAGAQQISLDGSGSYHATSLKADAVRASLSGAGDIEVTAQRTLDVTLTGSGSVRYRGKPRITQRVDGAGSVEKMD